MTHVHHAQFDTLRLRDRCMLNGKNPKRSLVNAGRFGLSIIRSFEFHRLCPGAEDFAEHRFLGGVWNSSLSGMPA